ncbi:MAG: alpha/beta hydrolase [Cytophagales bacterium]|nr:alpha/beta hydrolase [Cytophagales bacterium]
MKAIKSIILLLFVSVGSFAQSINNRIDPESKLGLDALSKMLPGGFQAVPEITQRRAIIKQIFYSNVQGHPDVIITDYKVPGLNNAPDILIRVFTPKSAKDLNPGIYSIHGGGMNTGSIEMDQPNSILFALKFNAVVVSVEYRLAPENPYPAPVEDCYAGIVWTAKNAKMLKIDPEHIAVYGGSAGGGLALATSLMARDKNFPKICFQMALYPMIDDRNITVSSQEVTNVGIWDRKTNMEAWKWYLGGKKADGYAAPAKAMDLKGLPPTFMDVGEADLFRDEDIEFASRLIKSGVTTEFHVYPGAFHASELFVPTANLSKRIWEARYSALSRALNN